MIRAALTLVLAAFALTLYWPTLDHPFVYDDIWNLQDNEALRLESVDAEALWRAARGVGSTVDRPLSNLSFAFDSYLTGPTPGSYRRTNLLIHAASGAAVFWLFLLSLDLTRRSVNQGAAVLDSSRTSSREETGWAFLGAMLWLAHPVQTQAVAYLHQRSTSLATLFFVSSVVLYVAGRRADSRAKRGGSFCLSAVSGLLALASKEIALTLPVVLILVEWIFFQDMRPRWLRERRVLLSGTGLLAAAAAGLYLFRAWPWIEETYAQAGYTVLERLLTESRVGVLYLSLFLWPHPSRLNLDHQLDISRSLIEPLSGLVSVGVWFLLLGLAIVCARRRRPMACFGFAWIFVTLLIESTVIPVELVAEHRLYLSSVGLLLILLDFARRCGRFAPGPAVGLVVVLATVVLGAWTVERNRVWSDELLLWQDTVRKSPDKARPQNNLGWALARADRRPEAIQAFRTALSIRPSAETHLNLGQALLAEGQTEEATEHLLVASGSLPRSFGAQYHLGVALLHGGRAEDAVRFLRESLRIEPENPEARYELANALWLKGNVRRAASEYRRAIAASASLFRRHRELAVALASRGRVARAAECYEDLLAVRPGDAALHYELAESLARAGDGDGAMEHCVASLELDAHFEPARLLLVELAGVVVNEGFESVDEGR